MNIIICGAGEVGRHSAEVLGAEGAAITIIDRDATKLAAIEDVLDVQTLRGDVVHADVLLEAGVAGADVVIAATDVDEINLLAASLATGLGAGRSIARVHHSAYYRGRHFDYAQHLGIDHLVCPDYATAQEIAQTVRNPAALAVERLARGRVEVQQFAVSGDARAVDRSLPELGLPGASRLAAVERDGVAFVPDFTTVIRKGDVVTLVGEVGCFEKARRRFVTEAPKRQRIMVMGGSPLAVWLCRALRGSAFSIRVYESDPARGKELADKLDWVTVVRVDPMDSDTLTLERIDQADAFIAVTDEDERNILAAARAKSLGAAKAMAVVQRSTYLHVLRDVGIDRAFSPRILAVNQIRRLLDESPMRSLATLAEGSIHVYEVLIPQGARKAIAVPLKRLGLPARTLIAAIQRGEQVWVPGADDAMEAGDRVVVIAPREACKGLISLFNLR